MITLSIDDKPVSVEPGATILEAARQVGVFIPTLCYLEGRENRASCMMCAVRDKRTDRILPACAARAEDGMAIDSDGPEVRDVRRGVLSLLFSDHAGECEGPCTQACPAGIDIPRMLRLAAAGRWEEAYWALRNRCALPEVLSRVCSAPCEKACRLGQVERPVRICSLKRFLAEKMHPAWEPSMMAAPRATGKTVAVVGAGPAGLAAADFLVRQGHACIVFDNRSEPGGKLRYSIAEDVLPREVLKAEVDRIRELGVIFRMEVIIGKDMSLETLRGTFDAVLVTAGEIHANNNFFEGIEWTTTGLKVDKGSWMTSLPKVFAAGGAVRPSLNTARSMAQGRYAAAAVDRFLLGVNARHHYVPFQSRLGKVSPEETRQFLDRSPAEVSSSEAALHPPAIDNFAAAQAEAKRCLGCGCLKADHCRLREYAGMYRVSPRKYRTSRRRQVERIREHPGLVFEPGKCIKCGRCVHIARDRAESLGLAFVGRGYNVRVGVPFDETLDRGLPADSAALCAELCPTGALVIRPEVEAEAGENEKAPPAAPGDDQPAATELVAAGRAK